MATYRIKSPTPDKFDCLARMVHNLRYYTKVWKHQNTPRNREKVSYWEDKIDTWLNENIDYTEISNTEDYHSKFNNRWVVKE